VDLNEPTPELFFEGPHLSPLPTAPVLFVVEQVDSFQDDQIIFTRDDGCRQYLVCWNSRPEIDDA